MSRAPRRLSLCVVAALVLSFVASPVHAQEPADFDLPAQALADSLRAIASRTSTNILFDRSLVAGRTAPALRGHATLEQALEHVLSQTGLTYRYLGEKTITIASVRDERARSDIAAQPATEDGTSGAQAGPLTEIVVTAERRSVGAQDVAASVVAFTPETLERSGIWNTSDLQWRTPGLLISTNGTYGQPYLRGVGSDIINPGADSPIAVFIDGAYQARQSAALTDLYDLQRVEILKGPQGTLYGRNASGGAINLITHDPDSTPAATAALALGNDAARRVDAMINIPLSDEWAVRAAGFTSQHDGYMHNVLDGSRASSEDVAGARVKLRYASSERFSAVFGAEYAHENDSRFSSNKTVVAEGLPLPVRDLASRFGYAPPAIPPDPFVVKYDFPPAIQLEQLRLNLTAHWRLGDLDVTSISAYTRLDDLASNDLDATEIDFAYDRESSFSRALTQTLQVSSDAARRLGWIAGVEYFEERGGQVFDARLPPFGPPSAIRFGPESPVPGFMWDSALRTHALAGFFDGRLALADHWTLAAGLRYSWEEKRADLQQTVIDPLGTLTGTAGTVVRPVQPARTFNAWTPQLRLEYRPANRVLLYAAATRGFKSGGFNLMNTGEAFDPEKLWSFELGVKATWRDNRLRTNATAFYYDYRDLQVNQFSGVTNLVTNAATSRIAGLEVEVVAQPVERLQADLAVAFLDAQYRRYLMLDANDPRVSLDLSGNRMPHAPRATLVAGLEGAFALGRRSRLTLRGEARYQSLIYFDQLDTPQLTQGGYALFGARAMFSPGNQHWSIGLFAENLTNKVYRQSMVRVDKVLGTIESFGTPRTYGIRIRTEF